MANLYIYDGIFFGILTLLVVIFLIRKRKNLKREGIMYLYRTQVGINLINYIGKKYRKTLSVLGGLGIASGYILMGLMMYFLGLLVYIYLFVPSIVQAVKIPPIMPLVPYVPEIFKIDFLPPFYATYWIIAIAVIAVFHEFAHGIIARRYDIPIKTTGFGFLGPFLAAFVEPDDKIMEKKSKYKQIAVLAAGTFANILLTIFFFILFVLFFYAAYSPAGVLFDAYVTGDVQTKMISSIGGVDVENLGSLGLIDVIDENNIENTLFVDDGTISKNLTEVLAGDDKYLIPIEDIKSQLEKDQGFIRMYLDLPAIRNSLDGAIIEIDDIKVKSRRELSNLLEEHKPGDTISITTKLKDKTVVNEIVLGEDIEQKDRAMLGIGYRGNQRGGLFGFIFNAINLFKEPGTHYEPKIMPDLTFFIYNLIWWLILINFSVALMNMLPFTIFDGGRMFLLTVWGITKSEKVAKIAFKFMTYLILAALVLLIFGWVKAMYL